MRTKSIIRDAEDRRNHINAVLNHAVRLEQSEQIELAEKAEEILKEAEYLEALAEKYC